MNTKSNTNWLIADIGATSCRCGIYSRADKAMHAVQVYRNNAFAGFQELLTEYLGTRDYPPENCALAIAAPVDGDQIQMINRDWQFSGNEIAHRFGFKHIKLMNDFHAIAYGLPAYGDDDRIEIGRATHYRKGNLAVLGPGSGLGMSAWVQNDSIMSGVTMCGEGGHTTVAGRNAAEDAIVGKIRDRYGHCSAERVLSGPGIVALHQAMHDVEVACAEEIAANADEPLCAATLNQFFLFLGATAADLALVTGAQGVYIAGGIVPANIKRLQESGFRARFEDKNRYVNYMRAIPTWVITAREPGLTGLAAYIERLPAEEVPV